jgi:two-component system CheB/CheR fusion protein
MADEQDEKPDPAGPPSPETGLSTETELSSQSVASQESNNFFIVGIGASAGGFEALEVFFYHLPPDSGMAFVIVTHQPPYRVSLLPELLAKRTAMPVHEVVTGMQVKPNEVYLAPPGMHLALLHSVLQPMSEDSTRSSVHFPIDYFFRSLADDQKEKAICVVLSGTGTDGALGLRAVKGAGGLTMAQEERSAKFAGMPSSAIMTGLVDYILPVDQMPHALLTVVQGSNMRDMTAPVTGSALTPDQLRQIYILLRNHTKHDFSAYKTSTLGRRIERRMSVHQIQTAEQYLRFLHEYPYELDLLFQELLIGVTNFFRDPKAFESLATTALPDLLLSRLEQHTLRVWVPGCSTGEEAYSIAIVLRECMDHLQQKFPVQIFATDLNSQAIEKARAGLYPESIIVDVSPERLERYFSKEDNSYRVKREIREMVVFAQQDLLTDPPFTKLNLLSCRNLLIYLTAEAQQQLVPLLHYTLNPGGILFLGSSETVGGFTDLFATLDHRWKIFRCKKLTTAAARFMEFSMPSGKAEMDKSAVSTVTKPLGVALGSLVERLLIQQFAPPSLIVNDHGDIVYIHGLTGLFLQPAPGPPSLNLFTMAREGLQMDLMAAARQAVTQEKPVVHKGIQVKTNGSVSTVDVTVQKITGPEPLRGLLLVTFEVVAEKRHRPRRAKVRSVDTADQNRETGLEGEIQNLRKMLQSTVEEANTANEELKSANEELQSTNEELQSSNEELETSKEEMQSLNEELQTVNNELQSKVEDLSHANDDMQNLLNSTDIATIFLDNDLRIKRFTPQAKQIFKVIPSDTGRPIEDLASSLHYDRLRNDAQEVLQTLASKELEVSTVDGKWYIMRMLPYRTSENMIDGLVVIFTEITRQKQAEWAITEAQQYAESIIDTVREPLVVLDAEMKAVSANRAFYRTFQVAHSEVIGQHMSEWKAGTWNISRLRQLLGDILAQHSTFEDFEMEITLPSLGRKKLLLNARGIERAAGLPSLILLAMEEVAGFTQQMRQEETSNLEDS